MFFSKNYLFRQFLYPALFHKEEIQLIVLVHIPGNVILCQWHRAVGVNGLSQFGAGYGVYPFNALVTGEIYFFRQIHVIIFYAVYAFVFIAYHIAVAVVEILIVSCAVLTAVVLEVMPARKSNQFTLTIAFLLNVSSNNCFFMSIAQISRLGSPPVFIPIMTFLGLISHRIFLIRFW